MKNIITILLFFAAFAMFGQVVTGTPSGYTVIDENVEIIFDVTGVKDNDGNSIEGKDLYIWTWSSAGDAKTNGGWNNLGAGAQLTKISDTEYRMIFPITNGTETYNTIAELYGAEAAPGSITSIGFLLRDQAPTFQTGDSSIPFSAFIFVSSEVRTFPSQATTEDIVSMRFNKDFSPLSNPAMTGAQNISVHIEPTNDASAAIQLNTVNTGQYYQASIIPAASFQSLFDLGTLAEIKYYFFDTDNPTIKSAEGTIRLVTAAN